jgi:hypothetical protein
MPTESQLPLEIHDATDLTAYLRQHMGSDHFVSTTLKTDDRVIARVTDGIYRQPGSALRELIVNAYDADATQVIVKTDAPRFERIEVSDNGRGMSPEVVAHLLFHIGGSAKRHEDGRTLGVTAESDSLLSPGGRRLIGKIGIGLFSVSQLTRSFQIITKVAGDEFRTVATVTMKQYADEESTVEEGGRHKYESGKVKIWREKAVDIESQGTTIVLTSIRPQARDTLRSREIWEAIERETESFGEGEPQTIAPPRFHIGCVDVTTTDLLVQSGSDHSSLPWDSEDAPDEAFRKLVRAVWDEIGHSSPNPKIEDIFDYYLRMVWQLSLSIPLSYVAGHLFDKSLEGWAEAFELSNKPKGQAVLLELKKGISIRKQMGLSDPTDPVGGFVVLFDELKLFRPIEYEKLPTTSHAIKKPLVFLGKCRETFPRVQKELSGGPLSFEAYLFWTPKVAPVEHQGVLIRIHGASGTLFDSTFMRYQVAEQTRRRQITCEIFVNEGLDSALNIDRESFNTAHPHSVYITKWLHEALRQLINAQKKLAKEFRDRSQSESKQRTLTDIQKVANDVWAQEVDEYSAPPLIEFVSSTKKDISTAGDTYIYKREDIVSARTKASTAPQRKRDAVLEKKLEAIAQVLASFGLLDAVSKNKQGKLLKAIYQILDATEG